MTSNYQPFFIFVISIAASLAHQSCNTSNVCPRGYFCNIDDQCIGCVQCSDYHRQSILNCAKTVQQCGPCYTGFQISVKKDFYCHPNGTNNSTTFSSITSRKSYTITTWDLLLIFTMLVPAFAVLSVTVTSLLNWLYRKEIQQKAKSCDRYFEYGERDAILL